jgi:hydroxymethylpyrimidine pyrophosphatase-like HAD family hydrolase
MIRLIVIDLDGTLLDSEKKIHLKNEYAIRRLWIWV